jgi:hypothetical protein
METETIIVTTPTPKVTMGSFSLFPEFPRSTNMVDRLWFKGVPQEEIDALFASIDS